MATFVVTTPVNIDTLAGKAGQDTYTINGGGVTLDQDSRFGVNAATNATLGAVTVSATLGGDFVVDARHVRLIPYDTGSGTVPAYNTTISQGGASGLLIGVYSALNVAPTTPGSAMPASGYIKIKQWNSVAYSAGALTGISANATGVDVVGWIEIVGNEQATAAGVMTFNGLGNPTTPQFRGAPYEIGTTPATPARTDTYQIPTNGNNCYMPAVFVETSPGSGVYDKYLTTTSTATLANVATDARRGKYCWVSTGGVLRFGHDGTNFTGGHLPAGGCKIVTGNIFLTMATNAAPTVNTLTATPATRYRFGGATLANLTMDWVTCNWYMPLTSFGEVNLTNSSFVAPTIFTQLGEKAIIDNCAWGVPVAISNTGALDFTQCGSGALVTNTSVTYGVFPGTGRSILRSNLSRDFIFDGCEFGFTGVRSTTSNYGMTFASGPNTIVRNCVIAGTISHTLASEVEYHDNEFWFDHADIVNVATQIATLFAFTNVTDSLTEYNTFPIAGQLPRAGIFTTTNGLRNKWRNMGDYDTPVDFTLYAEEDALFDRTLTTITVTTASPHGMSTGHRIFVYRSENTNAVTTGGKDITVTGTNTFTFTATNSGTDVAKKMSFWGSCSASAVLFDVSSTNTEDCQTQNVHIKGFSGAIWSINSTSINTEFKNVSADQNYISHATVTGTNTVLRSIQIASSPGVVAATLGTHWEDMFVCGEGQQPDVAGVSWTRSASNVTVTSPNHGLRVGDVIQTYDSSNPGGAEQEYALVTVATKDTFVYSGLNSGALSGTISYRTNEGFLHVAMNAPIPTTVSQAYVTSGAPAFTGQGTLAAFNIGDQIVFETPDFILGHDHFPIMWPNLPSSGGSPRNNCDIEYQIDRGSGYSAWKNMHVKRSNGAGTSGASTITLDDTTGLAVDDYVWLNTGIAGLQGEVKIVSIDSSTQITVDKANTATFSAQTLAFGHHPSEASFPSTGIKIKARLTVTTAFANAASYLQIPTNTTTASRNRLYAQDVDTVAFTISGLPTGTTVALYDNTDSELLREDNITSGSFVYEYIHSGVDFTDNYYVIWHEDYVPYKSDLFDLTATDLGLSYTPIDDPIYDAAHDDRYTVDFPNKLIIMDTGETQYDVPGAYSHWKDQIFLADNFTYDFAYTILGGVTYAAPRAIPAFTALINAWKIRPDEANHTLTVENGILYVEGGGDPFVDTLGAYTVRIPYAAPVDVLTVTSIGTPVITGDIADVPTAAENAEATWSNNDTYDPGTKGGDVKIIKILTLDKA